MRGTSEEPSVCVSHGNATNENSSSSKGLGSLTSSWASQTYVHIAHHLDV